MSQRRAQLTSGHDCDLAVETWDFRELETFRSCHCRVVET